MAYNKEKTPVFISRAFKGDLKEIVEEYQKDTSLRITQQYVLEKLITDELERIKKGKKKG